MTAALQRLRASLTREWPLELFSLLALVVPLMLLLAAWDGLPETVPVHFDAAGEPDRYGSKGSLWIIHLVSFGMWLLFTVIQALPVRSLNVPVAVTPGNEAHMQRVTSRALAATKAILLLVMGLIAQQVLNSAQGGEGTLSVWVMLLAGLGPLPVLIWMVVAAQRKPRESRGQLGGS